MELPCARKDAWLLAALVPWFWWSTRRVALSPWTRWWCDALPAVLLLQLTLGIVTLLLAVPVALGAAHQAGALLLLTAALVVNHGLQTTAAMARDELTVQP